MTHFCKQAQEWLILCSLRGLGCVLLHRLLAYFGSPGAVLAAGERLLAVPGIGPVHLENILSAGKKADAKKRAARELDQLHRSGVSLISSQCSCYPAHLLAIHDPPLLLYAKGDISLLQQPAVAIVGARAASQYGRRMAGSIAADLSGCGVCVVSGGAYGIDHAAHEGALRGPGRSICVLGCGVDVVYPRSHAALFSELAVSGLLVSEYPLGIKPEGFRFPERNRIVSGLSLGVVVVEAAAGSGSLITASLALDQGRDVFAVPGRADSIKSAGCHRLIQHGAYLVQSAGDVIRELGLAGQPVRASSYEQPAGESSTGHEAVVLSSLDAYPVDIETLIRLTGISARTLQGLLLELELAGRVRRVDGNLYELMKA